MRLMNSPAEITGPINLGNPVELSIRELAELVIELTGSTSNIEFHPLPPDDPRQRQPDISRAKAQLDWAPTVCLREGLEKTIPYFEQMLRSRELASVPAS
jgi:UDP-glucuronate decarboxylase